MPRTTLAMLVFAAACAGADRGPARMPAVEPTTIASGARPILDAWARAVGGRARLAALAATHLRGAITKGGLTGTIDLWETARGERREEITQSFLHELRVFDGTRGWLVDRNGEVRDLAGFELDDQLALAYLGAHAALLPARRPGTVSATPDGALVLAPRGGHRPVTMTFDPASGLPASFVRRDGEKLRTTHLSDWRTIDGVRVPFAIREENGDPNDAVTIQLESVDHGRPPPGAFVRPPDRAPDMTIAGDVAVPIDLVAGGLVFVNVSIDGTPLSFVLDSGAESTVLNASRLPRLHLEATGTFAAGAGGGDVVVSYVRGVTTQVGAATVADQIVDAIPLDALQVPLGRPIDGILGYDFLSRFVVELDYADRTLRLHDRATFHHPGGTPIPITLEDSTPELDASVTLPGRPAIPGHFVLDTGCLCEVQLSAPFTDAHHLLDALPGVKQVGYSAGAGGQTHQLTATIGALQIGDHLIPHPRADFSRDKTGATADPELAGLIGSLVWQRFVLVLDYRRKQAWLDPRPAR